MLELLNLEVIQIDKNIEVAIPKQIDKKLKTYAGDYRRFEDFCLVKGREANFESLEVYLYETIQSGLQLSTLNRRSVAVKNHLDNKLNQLQTYEQLKRIAELRNIYNN